MRGHRQVHRNALQGHFNSSPSTPAAKVAGGALATGGSLSLQSMPGLTSKRLAGVMTWWVPGVRDVVNGIEVVPPEDDNPDMIGRSHPGSA